MSGAQEPLAESMDKYLESSLESVDKGEHFVAEAAQEMGFDEEAVFQLGYAVREALVNAVVHGNRYSANKKVHFVLRRSAEQLEITIEDEGAGFDPDRQTNPLAEENLLNQSGRGIMIIRAFTDQFRIEPRPEGGTRVTLVKLLAQEP